MGKLKHLTDQWGNLIAAPALLYCGQAKKAKVTSDSCVGKNKRHYLNIIEEFLTEASV